jgi:hypothetical protein
MSGGFVHMSATSGGWPSVLEHSTSPFLPLPADDTTGFVSLIPLSVEHWLQGLPEQREPNARTCGTEGCNVRVTGE